MNDKENIGSTADELRESVAAGAAANVDDILGEILEGSGDYSAEYSDMISKYRSGGGAAALAASEEPEAPPADRFPRRDYTAEADEAIAAERRIENRISRKMAPSVRETVRREGQEAVRPEFTYDGSVRYPTFGVGESGERVVFDADWEKRAKEEAARIGYQGAASAKENAGPAPQFRITGAQEAPHRRPAEPKKPAQVKRTERTAPEFGAQPEIQERIMDIKELQEENVNIPPEIIAANARERVDEAEPPEERGLSPEKQRTVDNAVLEAFSSDFYSDLAFKEKWKDTVEKAQRRKEQLAQTAQKSEAQQRSKEKQAEQERRVAEMERALETSPPPAQKGFFTPAPAAFGADSPEDVTESIESPALSVVERLDTEVLEKARAFTAAESKVRKTPGEKFAFFMRSRFSKEGWRRFRRRTLPCKGDGAKESIRKVVRCVSFIALVCGLVYLAIYYHNYRARIRNYNEINRDIEQGEHIEPYDLDNAWAQMRAAYPDVDFPEGMNIKFAKTYAMNSDTVGLLTIQEEKDGVRSDRVKTVLVQGAYEDYYLYRDFYKKYSRYGSPEISTYCNMGPEGLSKNTMVFGHNTHDHLIFNRLEDYMTVDGYLAAPIITLDTLYETTKWKVFAVMLTNADPIDDNGKVFDYLYSSFNSDAAFMAKMKQIMARSMIHTGVDVEETDKTLMLYTCCRYRFNSGRLVIVARQLREGESEEINSSLVYYDSSAIFPAAYYTGTPHTTEKEEDTTKKEKAESKPEKTTKAPEENKDAADSNDPAAEAAQDITADPAAQTAAAPETTAVPETEPPEEPPEETPGGTPEEVPGEAPEETPGETASASASDETGEAGAGE